MYSAKSQELWFLKVCLLCLFPFTTASPLPATFYQKFIDSLVADRCEMPKNVILPFSDVTDPSPFAYLSAPLIECQKPEDQLKTDEKARLLCNETFDNLRDIACSRLHPSSPAIKPNLDLENVCEEFSKLKGILPKREDYLSSRFGDKLVCDVICSDKFKTMCQTLLWSYDVQAQIKNFAQPAADQNQVDEPQTGVKNDLVNAPLEPMDKDNDGNQNEVDANFDNVDMDQNPRKAGNDGLEKNDIAAEKQIAMNPDNSTSTKKLDETKQNSLIPELPNIFQSRIALPKNNITTPQQSSPQVETKETPTTLIKVAESEIAAPSPKKVNDPVADQEVDKKTDVAKVSATTVKIAKATGVATTAVETNSKNSSLDIKGTEAEPNEGALFPRPEENELDGADLKEKLKETAVENGLLMPVTDGKEKNAEKPKEVSESASAKVSVDVSLKATSTTAEGVPGQNAEEDPDERESEQYYNDTENEDYPKLEFENTLTELKERKPIVKSSVINEVIHPNTDLLDNYDMHLSRNNFVRSQEDTPMIASFPEQEDSHFFFYFLSMVLILMAGYLLVHNKQKIIALIVEGRHERRRRCHGAAYKKLDTK